ncbi:MAG TPA: hypothetical protein VK540_24700 [Polyangiaceae bacterium]|nr:hypothetical protein [Polyangiaceae bacterium]
MPWFGIRSFYGHLWHLVASAIATQDIDSRDWMHPDSPGGLTKSVARTIDGDAKEDATSVTEALGRDVYIDFVADTGDDVDVSRAIAELVASEYEVPLADGEGTCIVPRGDILLFGGDTAYPVATSTEIEARLLRPWNEIFADRYDGKTRALLGIAGNHDWFDGLDGFARMFRARSGPLAKERASAAPGAEKPVQHFVSWMEAFAMGKHIVKRRALPLVGYEPVQRASYFALGLAPGIDLWGVDRQLRQINFQQRRFFWDRRSAAPSHSLLLCLPDPLYLYLEPSTVGTEMLQALDLDPAYDPMLCLAGDVHHYERWKTGPSIHLVAGGGGAFLHGARMARDAKKRVPDVEFPGPRASRALLLTVPWHVATGRGGIIPHLSLAALFAPALGVGLRTGPEAMDYVSIGAAALAAVVCAALAGLRKATYRAVVLLATAAGVLMALVPTATHAGFDAALAWLEVSPSPKTAALLVFGLAIFGGAFVFGCYLAALALFGLNHDQAFAALGHPGYKHIVRLRVRADGSAIDAWVIGLADPLGTRTPVLVDHVTFTAAPSMRPSRMPPAPSSPPAPPSRAASKPPQSSS